MEDEFITLRYGRNLAGGLGLVFNPGERVEGFSNPLWVLIMALAFRAHINILAFNRILCLAAALAHFPLICLIMQKHVAGGRGGISLLPPLLLAMSFPFIFWMKSGMETALASFLLLSGAGLMVSGRYYAGSFLIGLLSVTRPEGVIYLALLPVAFYSNERRVPWRRCLYALAPGIAVFMAYEIFRIFYFNDWVPNSFHAKVALASPGEKLRGLRYWLDWLFGIRGIALFASLAALAMKRESMFKAFPWIAVLILNAFFITAVGGDFVGGNFMPHFRFIVPAFSAAAILVGMGSAALLQKTCFKNKRAFRSFAAIFIIALAVLLHPDFARHLKATWYAFAMPSDLPVPAPTIRQRWKELWLTRRRQPNLFVGQWIKDNLSQQARIATAQCGLIPFASNARTIDLYGLMSREMAKKPVDERPGLLLSMKVEYVLLLFSLDPPSPTLLPELIENEDFQDTYCLKAVFASENYRRGSPGYVLFKRRAYLKDEECVLIPRLKDNRDIMKWLGESVNNKDLLQSWDYSYDIFR